MVRDYYEIIKNRQKIDYRRTLAIDLETLVTKNNSFLSGERIIAASLSYFRDGEKNGIRTDVKVAETDTDKDEFSLINWIDSRFKEIDPEIIIGYNHTGYDIPLLQGKVRLFGYGNRPRNLLFYLGTAWCLDMMYVIADDLWKLSGDYFIRKLDDVVVHERYSALPLKRVKNLVKLEGISKGDAIKHLWEKEREKFLAYCEGDTHDILLIFKEIFG